MGRIEARVMDVDLHLKHNEKHELKVFGTLRVGFDCPSCERYNSPLLEYEGNHPSDTERKCVYCEEPYVITTRIPIILEVGDRETVEINRQMQPIIDKIKKGE